MPCPSYSLVTFPLAKKPPRAAPSALRVPPRSPRHHFLPGKVERHRQPLTHPRAAPCCPAQRRQGPAQGLQHRPPVAPCLLITGIKSPAKDNSSGGDVLLQQLLTRLMGNFLWERSKQADGRVALETGAVSAAELRFASKCPRQDLPGSCLWDRNPCNLQSTCLERAKEGCQNRGTSVLVLGCVVTNNPALLHNQWWEPKVVSSNYYARVHSNRPPLVQEFTGKVLLVQRHHQAK